MTLPQEQRRPPKRQASPQCAGSLSGGSRQGHLLSIGVPRHPPEGEKRATRTSDPEAERRPSDGEGGIRTLEAGISPPNALAGRRLQPLGHFSGRGHRTAPPPALSPRGRAREDAALLCRGTPEGWQSGRMRRSRKPLSVQADRRFKSSPLRSTARKPAPFSGLAGGHGSWTSVRDRPGSSVVLVSNWRTGARLSEARSPKRGGRKWPSPAAR